MRTLKRMMWRGPATTVTGPTVTHGDTAMVPVRNTDWSSSVVDTPVPVSNSVIWIASASSLYTSDVRLRSPALKRASNCTVRPVSAAVSRCIVMVVYESVALESSLAKKPLPVTFSRRNRVLLTTLTNCAGLTLHTLASSAGPPPDASKLPWGWVLSTTHRAYEAVGVTVAEAVLVAVLDRVPVPVDDELDVPVPLLVCELEGVCVPVLDDDAVPVEDELGVLVAVDEGLDVPVPLLV